MDELKRTRNGRPRYAIDYGAFFIALVSAPAVVSALSFWTIVGLFAFPFGIVPHLVIGTPILLWAVGRIEPSFWRYAPLGLIGNIVLGVIFKAFPNYQLAEVLFNFGFIFAPLYAGTFGWSYAKLHSNPPF